MARPEGGWRKGRVASGGRVWAVVARGPGPRGRKEEGPRGQGWVRDAFAWNSALERVGQAHGEWRRRREGCAWYRERVTSHCGDTKCFGWARRDEIPVCLGPGKQQWVMGPEMQTGP